MRLIQDSINNPITVFVGLLLIVLFGSVSLLLIPSQLTPEVNQPEISITTTWRAAAPSEVEAEIIEPQEEVLRGLPGMVELRSDAFEGRGQINLTFSIDVDIQNILIEIINRLNQVSDYPIDADAPTIDTIGNDAQPIAWFIIKTDDGNDSDITSYGDYIEEVVQAKFEQIPGVVKSDIFGTREKEIRITFDPYKVADLELQIPDLIQQFSNIKDISGGSWDMGKRAYQLRFSGKYEIDVFGQIILQWRDGRPIYLQDVAIIKEQLKDRSGFVVSNGIPSIAVNVQKERGSNILQVMSLVKQASAELEAGPLKRAKLNIEQVYDSSIYIERSINVLLSSVGFGIVLVIFVLWFFLLRFRATLIVALSIPICLLVSFVMMFVTGHTLNVISLAALALSVGMVLDASIVVLENIMRLRENGMSRNQASVKGASEIVGALFATTTTTIAIFLPIVFLKDEVGQLFSDLATTISTAVGMSLLSAIIVVPTLAKLYLDKQIIDPYQRVWGVLSKFLIKLTDTPIRRAFWIMTLIFIPLSMTYFLRPQTDYLPNGNRNLVVAFIIPPPGSSIDDLEEKMARAIHRELEPYLNQQTSPFIERYFLVANSSSIFLGTLAVHDREVMQLAPVINRILEQFPDTLGFATQVSLFQGFGEGRSIDLNIQGKDIEQIMQAALQTFFHIQQQIPGVNVRPIPGLLLANPELRFQADERRLAEAGWDRNTLGILLRAFGDGLFIDDYFDGEQTLDIIVRSKSWDSPETLLNFPLATPNSGVLPFGELVTMDRTTGPDTILRINRRRTVTLQVTPPDSLSLEQTVSEIEQKIEPALWELLPEDGEVYYAGTADKLNSAIKSMSGSFILAILILYLLMSSLFKSFKDSLLVIISLPLATIGGIIALMILNLFTVQNMDLLTMIGFVILLGLVVNNAVLLVHKARSGEREGLTRCIAVEQAIRLRLRPIFMSTLTSILGTLPLLLNSGSGTELYRGLAAVIVGGMSVSTLFTLLLLPSLLRIGEGRHA